jgi:hypothetical protein
MMTPNSFTNLNASLNMMIEQQKQRVLQLQQDLIRMSTPGGVSNSVRRECYN